MTHARMERQISAYFDNELTADEARQVRVHVAGCARCQSELRRLQQLKRLMAALPERAPRDELWATLRQRLDESAPALWDSVLDAVRAAFRRPAVAAAAAALVVVLVAFPLVKGRVDRLRAAEVGVDVYVREHALQSAVDPFADRAYIGLLVSDANLVLIGEPRQQEKTR